MAFLLDDTTLKVENYIIVIEFYKLEFRWLIRILKKSKKMGTPISQREKR